MKEFYILFKLILGKNTPILRKGAICFLSLFIVTLLLTVYRLNGAGFFLYLLLFFPFLYTWYICSTIDLHYYHTNILTRAISRCSFYWSFFCFCLTGVCPLFLVAALLVMSVPGDAAIASIISNYFFILLLLSLDFILLTSIAYCFCILELPILSFLGVTFPALMVFKSEKIIGVLQVNYSFPLLISSLSDLNELYQFIGGTIHVTENITCALAFVWICQYFYKNKDLTK